jgi:hypothetical protein
MTPCGKVLHRLVEPMDNHSHVGMALGSVWFFVALVSISSLTGGYNRNDDQERGYVRGKSTAVRTTGTSQRPRQRPHEHGRRAARE